MAKGIQAEIERERAKVDKEITQLQKQIADCKQYKKQLDQMLRLARRGAGGRHAGTTPKTRRKKRRKRRGLTIPEAIIALLDGSSGPLSTSQIISGLKEHGVKAADTSVYSSINRMKDDGVLRSRPHVGRGNAYMLASKPAAKTTKPAAKASKKSAGKKKKGGKKKAGKKKAAKKSGKRGGKKGGKPVVVKIGPPGK